MSNILQDRVTSEWNKNAESRHKQIISKIDLSYHKVLIPTLLRNLGNVVNTQILDVGCGSGVLCSNLIKKGAIVTGIDPAKEMIRIAVLEYGRQKNLIFHINSVQNFSASTRMKFDIIISNMSLIVIENLEDALFSISSLLKPKGKFLFNITHPRFWNHYRQYEANDDFEYEKEHAQQGNFLISCDALGLPSPTTHFHRPLEQYLHSLKKFSFTIDQIEEPFPNPEDMNLYPEPWKFPRFLFVKCTKT